MAKIAIIYQMGQLGYVMSTFIKVLKEIKGSFSKNYYRLSDIELSLL